MFVKIEDASNDLILNIDNISSIHYTKPYKGFDGGYYVVMNNLKNYSLKKEQYEQICEILTKQV